MFYKFQWFIISGILCWGISSGIKLAYPTVMLPAITNVNQTSHSDIHVTLYEAYWIGKNSFYYLPANRLQLRIHFLHFPLEFNIFPPKFRRLAINGTEN